MRPISEVFSRDSLLYFLKEHLRNIRTISTGDLIVTKTTGSYATISELTASRVVVSFLTASWRGGTTIAQEYWTTVSSYGTGWAAHGSSGPGETYHEPAFMKDSMGFVHLQGLAQADQSLSEPTTIFTLPVGFRPSQRKIFGLIGYDTAYKMPRVDVAADGQVIVYGNVMTIEDNDWVSLEGVTFDTQ